LITPYKSDFSPVGLNPHNGHKLVLRHQARMAPATGTAAALTSALYNTGFIDNASAIKKGPIFADTTPMF
jgi:hypothetical protein